VSEKQLCALKYAQVGVVCAKESAFFLKIFAYLNKNVLLCTR
jgi:hypothetical protein